jgi:hypothetical protein
MFDELKYRFKMNIERVKNLVGIYGRVKSQGQGRKSVQDTDILRAAVVFLHASVEEVLRGIMREKLPDAEKIVLNDVPLLGTRKGGRPEKFYLGELKPFMGKKISQLIKESVNEYLGFITFNDTTEIMSRLESIKISYDDSEINVLSSISEIIERRHNIVHQADNNPETKQGSFHALAINQSTLEGWIEAASKFIDKIFLLVNE